MLGSLLQPHIWTANLLVIGLVQGLIVSLIAMGIVLVYRSSRVINFAVGDLGVPAAAVLAVMVGKTDWPYWPGLVFAVLDRHAHRARSWRSRSSGGSSKAPRVIVLVATIGIAELAQAVTHALPDYRTGELQISYPSPMTSQWTITSFGIGPFHVHDITITGPQLLAIIVVPIITRRAVVAARAHPLRRSRCGRRRPTPTSPGSRASARRSCRPRSGRSPASCRRSR